MKKANLVDLALVLPTIVDLAGNSLQDRTRKGGYFCHMSPKGVISIVARIGDPSEEKAEKYFRLCQEKAGRLAANPTHLSSWESRDESQQRYGGAVRFEDGDIYSFSGFPDLLDEASMLVAATCFSQRTQPSRCFLRIIEISHNHLALRLLAEWGKKFHVNWASGYPEAIK